MSDGVRCVAYSPTLGVYLGGFLGLGFWSRLDPAGQDGAPTFDDEEAVADFLGALDSPVADAVAVRLAVAAPAGAAGREVYATLAEVAAAGLPPWDPRGGADVSRPA